MNFPFPLARDRRTDRSTPVAAVDMTEADLRIFAGLLHNEAQREEEKARTRTDLFYAHALAGESRRLKRIADELRVATRIHKDGGATADTAPRHDSTEIPA